MSGEHIFSDTLLRLFDDVAPLTIDEQREKIHGSDPTVKDICKECNGGLSDADTTIRVFAESHLRNRKRNTSKPTVESKLLKLWVLKTAANVSRANQPHSTWWKTFIPYLRRKSENCDCDVCFTRWADSSPSALITELGVVPCIAARDALLLGFACGNSKFLRSQMSHATVIKVGYGVFLLLVWKSESNKEVRKQVLLQIKEFGWFSLDATFWLAPEAFNVTSCATFNVVANPFKSLIDLIEADK